MLEFKGFFGEIGQYLLEMVTGKISDKMRLECGTVKAYARKRSEIERDLIRSGINWHTFFETCDFMKLPTEEDKEFVATLNNQELMDFLYIMISAQKRYIDAFEETSLNCQILHAFYLLLKSEMELRPNLAFMPKGDGFLDYLESREDRLKRIDAKQIARIEGNLCIFCEGSNVRSNGSMWHCLDCGKNFRKKPI